MTISSSMISDSTLIGCCNNMATRDSRREASGAEADRIFFMLVGLFARDSGNARKKKKAKVGQSLQVFWRRP
jgi:hypothetical protein